jgi:tripartite-type tricarboxylate transporter receptor subunit TctC
MINSPNCFQTRGIVARISATLKFQTLSHRCYVQLRSRAKSAHNRHWLHLIGRTCCRGSAAFGLIAALAGISAAPTYAESWPTRPVTMVVPFAAGGPMDVVGRILQSALSDALQQPVIIENVGGAGGMTGTAKVAKSAPDGYQFLLGNVGTQAVIYAKVNRDQMQFASGGASSATHLGCALLNARIGINVTHVPYRGGGLAMQDVIAQRVDYLCVDTPVAMPQIASGTVKPIAILTRGRSPSLPNLASAQEQGLTDFEASNWSAFFLPKDTPSAIVQKLHDATVTAMNNPTVQKRFKENGIDLVGPERQSSDYLTKFVANEIIKWAGPIKASGLTSE